MSEAFYTIVKEQAPSPAFVVDMGKIESNLAILDSVQKRTGAKILLALKGFAMFSTFDVIEKKLHGITASGLYEALLGRDHFDGEVHVYSPAYKKDEMRKLASFAQHIVFNHPKQKAPFKNILDATGRKINYGLRINPEHRTAAVELYDPCAPHSRLGITRDQLKDKDFESFNGLHFHTLCEQNSDALEETLAVIEEKFGSLLHKCEWVNFGGGHHITRDDYDIDRLCKCIERIRDTYKVQVYLEPGEAVALNAGVLVTTVMDVMHNGMDIALLDTSATTHMPDVLEMPYRPGVVGAGQPNEKQYTYRLGGLSCLAGDVIGDYSFDEPLKAGDKLIFTDMAHYSMVKTTTFNGVPLPAICKYDPNSQTVETIKTFGYEDYKMRLS